MYLFSRILPPIITNNNNNHNQPHNPNHPDTTGIDSSFCSTGGPLSPTTSTTSSTVHRNLARTRSRGDYDYSPANSPGPDPRNINRYRSPVSERYRTPPVTIREEDDEDSYIDYDDEELYYVTTPTELKRPRLPLVEAEEKELAKKKTGTGLDRGLLNSAIAAAKGIIREDSSDPYAWAFNGGNKTPLSAEVRSIGSRSSSSAGSSPRHRRLSQQQPYVEEIPDGVYTPPLIHEAREYTPPLSHSTTASQELPDDYRRALQRQLQRQRDFDDAVANPIGVEEFDHHFDPSASSPVISRRNTAAAVYTMSAPPVRYVDASQLSREDLDSKQNHYRHNQRSGSVCSTTMSSSSSSANQPRPGQISRSSTWSYGMVSPSGPTTPYSPPPPTYENSEFINRLRADQEREDNLMKAAILASQQKDAYDQILDPHKRELEDAELLVALEESRRIQREEEEFYTVLAASRQDDEERIRREAAQREEEERLRFQREREQRERMERLQREKENRERAERLERERLERERHDREILERKRMELDRLEEEHERLERERMEQGRPRWGGGSVDFSSAPKPDQGGYAVQYSPAGRLSQHPSSIGNKAAAAEQPTATVSDAYYNSIINSTGRRNSGEGSPIEGSPYESPAQRRFREMLRETAAEAAAERGE